jgi:hypothetical protein
MIVLSWQIGFERLERDKFSVSLLGSILTQISWRQIPG